MRLPLLGAGVARPPRNAYSAKGVVGGGLAELLEWETVGQASPRFELRSGRVRARVRLLSVCAEAVEVPLLRRHGGMALRLAAVSAACFHKCVSFLRRYVSERSGGLLWAGTYVRGPNY